MTKADVARDVRELKGRKIEELRAVWRDRFGAPPRLQSGELIRRLLAERIQKDAFGGDEDLDRRLNAMVSARRRGRSPAVARPTFKPGTVLIREYDGVQHRVEVLEEGFLWRGEVAASLSEVARRITGSRWNGPLFFGLRGTGK